MKARAKVEVKVKIRVSSRVIMDIRFRVKNTVRGRVGLGSELG